MQRLYKWITALLAFAGCVSLIVTGELMPVMLLPGVFLFPGYYKYLRDRAPLNRWIIAGLALIEIFVVLADALFISRDYLIAVAHMTIVFQALKSFDIREPWDPLQIFFMALLQLIVTSELSHSLAVGGVFVIFLFIFMAALVIAHFMKEETFEQVRFRNPVIAVSLVALLITISFFLIVPRISGGLWSRKAPNSIQSVGFSGEVGFDSFGDVLEDDTVVMRVELEGPLLPHYWRGTTLDAFDGRNWKNTFDYRRRVDSQSGVFYIADAPDDGQLLTVQRVVMEPVDTDVIFSLGTVVRVESGGRFMFRNIQGSVFNFYKKDRRFQYTAFSTGAPFRESYFNAKAQGEKYLQLPEGMQRIRELALQAIGTAETSRTAAMNIELYLQRNYEYSLHVTEPPTGTTAVEYFLFESRQGYCQYYATAMALMLRTIGIPSRIVTGFKGGDVNDSGQYVIVRQKNAHSWVEALINNRWERFDPTPVVFFPGQSRMRMTLDSLSMYWYRYVIGFSSSDQKSLLEHLSRPWFTVKGFPGIPRLNVRPIYVLVILVGLLPLFMRFLTRWLAQRGIGRYSLRYLKFRDFVRVNGGRVSESSSSREVADEALRIGLDPEDTKRFLTLYERTRFAEQRLTPDEERLYENLARQVTRRPGASPAHR